MQFFSSTADVVKPIVERSTTVAKALRIVNGSFIASLAHYSSSTPQVDGGPVFFPFLHLFT